MSTSRSSPAELIRISWVLATLFTALVLLGFALHHLGLVLTLTGPDLIAPNGMPVGADFIAFWSAGWLALTGNPAGAYDLATIQSVEQMAVPASGALTPWLYPPVFLLLVAPLGALDYVHALVVFIGLGLLVLLLCLWRIRPHWSTPLLVLAYPALWLNVFSGQNAFITASLFALGVLALPHPRAGLWIGLLSYKPQLGVLFPVVLLVQKSYRVLIVAGLAVLGVCLLSWGIFGTTAWQAFFSTLGNPVNYLEQGRIPLHQMASAFSALRQAGASVAAAYAFQALCVGVALMAVLALWRSAAAPRIKQASLVLGALMVTPHLFHYDLAILILPLLLWLREAEATHWLRGERPLLYFSWIAPPLLMPLNEELRLGLYPLLFITLQLMLLRRAHYSAKDLSL